MGKSAGAWVKGKGERVMGQGTCAAYADVGGLDLELVRSEMGIIRMSWMERLFALLLGLYRMLGCRSLPAGYLFDRGIGGLAFCFLKRTLARRDVAGRCVR